MKNRKIASMKMTDQELSALLKDIEDKANDAIDKLIARRISESEKATTRYMIKKLEVIIGAVHRAQDRMPVEFRL